MIQPRAVIFDFDGTLADSYEAIAASVNHVRAAHDLPPLPVAEVRRYVGHGPAHLLEHTVPNVDLAVDLPLYKAHHPSVLREGTRLLPGVAETLRALHVDFALGVCSNKLRPFTETLLGMLGVAEFFQTVVGPEDAPKLKPAPDMLWAALRKLQVTSSQALYVGDMTIDIATARAAGVPVWVVATGSDSAADLEMAQPDRLLGQFREIAGLLVPRATTTPSA